jgi:hypothetical protein
MRIYFDIETGPTDSAAEFCEPVEAPSTYKDPVKIAEYVAKAKAAQLDKAALSPVTGRVLAIGVMTDDQFTPWFYEGPEDCLLRDFWKYYSSTIGTMKTAEWVGFNTHDFDWPFLVQRSWINKVVPSPIFQPNGRYLRDHLIDLRKVWQCGNRMAPGSLDTIARAMGLGGKNGHGSQFAQTYATDPKKAKEYLANDLYLTKAVAERML